MVFVKSTAGTHQRQGANYSGLHACGIVLPAEGNAEVEVNRVERGRGSGWKREQKPPSPSSVLEQVSKPILKITWYVTDSLLLITIQWNLPKPTKIPKFPKISRDLIASETLRLAPNNL
jgi:hypothetical protein